MIETHRFRSQRHAEGFKQGLEYTDYKVGHPIYHSDAPDNKKWFLEVDRGNEINQNTEVLHDDVEPMGYNKIILESGAGYSWASFQTILLGNATIRGDSRTNYAAQQVLFELVRNNVDLDGETQHFVLKLMKDFKVDVRKVMRILDEHDQDEIVGDQEKFWKGDKKQILNLWDFRIRMFETKGGVMSDVSNGPQIIDIA